MTRSHPRQHRSRRLLRSPRSRASQQAFTLVELLITAVIMGVIVSTGSTMMVSQIRSSALQESTLRLEENWGRIHHLMDREITESASASAVPNTSLTLTLPAGQTITYLYQSDAATLSRTGPPINDDGTLNLAAGTANVTFTLLSNVSSFAPAVNNSREPAYTLGLRDGLGASFTGRSTSTRSRTTSYP